MSRGWNKLMGMIQQTKYYVKHEKCGSDIYLVAWGPGIMFCNFKRCTRTKTQININDTIGSALSTFQKQKINFDVLPFRKIQIIYHATFCSTIASNCSRPHKITCRYKRSHTTNLQIPWLSVSSLLNIFWTSNLERFNFNKSTWHN